MLSEMRCVYKGLFFLFRKRKDGNNINEGAQKATFEKNIELIRRGIK